jgi:multiple sugar transport system permease protein
VMAALIFYCHHTVLNGIINLIETNGRRIILDIFSRISRYWNKPEHAAYLFIAPAVILIVLFNILPLITSFVVSMTNANVYFANTKFVGFDNFVRAFSQERFWNSWKVTGLFTLFDVPFNITFALIIAYLVKGVSLRDKLLRSVYILPIICSASVIGLMWRLFLNPNIGWAVNIMNMIGLEKVAIFSDYDLAIYGIIFISIWRGFGVTSMLIVAGMQAVPNTLYEASEIDGANKARQLISVTIPGIAGTLWFIFITRIINSFQVFDLVYVITGGGPAFATETVVSYVYNTAFNATSKLGYATAVSETLFVVILIVTLMLYYRMTKDEMGRVR